MGKRLLIFHPTVAPYRIDFFNSLCGAFDTRVCLNYRNLRSQQFDYERLVERFRFTPIYLRPGIKVGRHRCYRGGWRQLGEFRPDVVVTNEFGFSTWVAILHRWLHPRARYRIVSLCDDSYDMVAHQMERSRLHRWARRIAMRFIDDAIFSDSRVVAWYRQRAGRGLFFPIVTPDDAGRAAYSRLLARSRATVEEHALAGKHVFLFVGRLVGLKNIPTLLRAYSRLDPTQAALVVVGDGPEAAALRAQADELGVEVVFTGRLEGDDLLLWYNVADSFVLPSTRECFGAVTHEALLAGCWCLVSEKAGSACLIEEGVNGHVFPPEDEGALAALMADCVARHRPNSPLQLKENHAAYHYDALMKGLVECL